MAPFLKVDIRGGERFGYPNTVVSQGAVLTYSRNDYKQYYTTDVREIKVVDKNESTTIWLMVDKENLTELIDALMVLRAGME